MSNFVNNVQTYNLTVFVKGEQEYEKTDASRVQLTGRYQIFSRLQQTTRHLFIFEPKRSRATGAIFPFASFGRRKLRFLFFFGERGKTRVHGTREGPRVSDPCPQPGSTVHLIVWFPSVPSANIRYPAASVPLSLGIFFCIVARALPGSLGVCHSAPSLVLSLSFSPKPFVVRRGQIYEERGWLAGVSV